MRKCRLTALFQNGSENASPKSLKRIGRISTIRPFQKVWDMERFVGKLIRNSSLSANYMDPRHRLEIG